ncbi:MAG: hypothetical protein ACE5JM_00940, partial [Armatimonadota bacterium]
MKHFFFIALAVLIGLSVLAADLPETVAVTDFAGLPANTWTLVHVEDACGGKTFSRVVAAENVDRLYLWGIGGTKPVRNRYLRYELESYAPLEAEWAEALPAAKRDAWADGKHPPFTLYGQRGDATGPP